MPYVALTMHRGDPASLGMIQHHPWSEAEDPNHQCPCLTLFMVCFSQVISSCRHVLCLPLKQPPWSHSHTAAWVPAWDRGASTWASQTGAQGCQTLSRNYKPWFLLWHKNCCVFPLPKVCSHYLLNISVNMPRKAFRPLSANHRFVIGQLSAFKGWHV